MRSPLATIHAPLATAHRCEFPTENWISASALGDATMSASVSDGSVSRVLCNAFSSPISPLYLLRAVNIHRILVCVLEMLGSHP